MIRYTFTLPGGSEYAVEVDVDRAYQPRPIDDPALPTWTELAFRRCPNCPLPLAEHPRCPAAVDVHAVAGRFGGLRSYEEVEVRVDTLERSFVRRTDVQSGLQSLFGLLMATSGCPILGKLRPLARHHLPFANVDETVWRAAAGYLLQQYFRARDGKRPDFELVQLRDLYRNLEIVNRAFSERIREAGEEDANVNAVVLMSFLSEAVSLDLDGLLDDIRKRMLARPAR